MHPADRYNTITTNRICVNVRFSIGSDKKTKSSPRFFSLYHFEGLREKKRNEKDGYKFRAARCELKGKIVSTALPHFIAFQLSSLSTQRIDSCFFL